VLRIAPVAGGAHLRCARQQDRRGAAPASLPRDIFETKTIAVLCFAPLNVFFSVLTGKTPLVILIGQDGYEGRVEFGMRRVADQVDAPYGRCSSTFIQRWAAMCHWAI